MADKLIKIRYDVETVDIEKADEIFKRIAASTDKADKELKEFSRDSKKAGQDASSAFNKSGKEADKFSKSISNTSKPLNNLSSQVVKFGALLGGLVVAKVFGEFSSKIFDVTAQFQKLEAVLTNTLGSKSAAQAAMLQIQDFAAKTPFSVAELTESFVKLTNAGIKPTQNQMRQLGDLAASQGKEFNQLTEAIIDAQTGEFERLKEFGVRAQKEGDKVKFTFKGVQTQVDFTSESISKYITGLGDLKGVSGSMAAISSTLSGQVSNLGDNFDQLFLALGRSNSGVVASIINGLSNVVSRITDIIKGQRQLIRESQAIKVEDLISGKTIEDLKKINRRAYEELEETQRKYYEIRAKIVEEEKKTVMLASGSMGQMVKSNQYELLTLNTQLEKQRQRLEGFQQAYQRSSEEITKAQEEAARKSEEAAAKEIGILVKLRAELKEAQEARENATTTKDINIQNTRILNIQKEIDRLTDLGEKAKKAYKDLKELNSLGYDSGIEQGVTNALEVASKLYERIYGEQITHEGEAIEAIKNRSDVFIKSVGDQINARSEQFNRERSEQQRLEQEEKERLERRKQNLQTFTEVSQNLYSSIVSFQNQLDDQRIYKLEENKEKELALAGKNSKERANIEVEFDNKIKIIRRRQAEREKRLALFQAIIGTSQAVVQALASGKYPLNLVFAALTAAAGAVQIAAISNQQIPQYAKGTKSVPGKGNKDTEHALLTPGEMVIPVATKKAYAPVLNAIYDKKIDPKILNDIVSGKSGGSRQIVINENKELLEEFRKRPVNNFSFDEDGFKRYVEKGRSRTQYLQKRYSSR